MATHLVCLSFDFDALSFWIAIGQTSPTPLSRGEFGAVGARRLLRLLAEKPIRASWFIPGQTIETYPEICREIAAAGHEIGHHGYTHRSPLQMTREDEARELERGNDAIRTLTGKQAAGYRSPAWDLSEHSAELLLAHGFVYDSSMMGHDYLPYQVRRGDVVRKDGPTEFGAETDLVEMPISWSLDDFPHFEFARVGKSYLPGLASAEAVLGNWIDDFLYMTQTTDWGVLTYTFHPFVIGRGHRMMMLSRLIDRLAAEGAQFMTMGEACAQYLERRRAGALVTGSKVEAGSK